MPTVKRIPKYRLHKSDGRAVVTLNVKDIMLGKYGTEQSRQMYDRYIAEWLANGRTLPEQSKPADITIMELVDRFWRHAQAFYVNADGTPAGEQDNYRMALRPLKALYGFTHAAAFGPKALRAVRQKMIEMGWCRTRINRQIGRLKHVFGWAVSQELIPAATYQALLTVKGLRRGKSEARESEPVKSVPEAHIDAIEHHVSPQVWAMVQLQRLTGMRSTEVCIMRGCDIDTTAAPWVYRPAFHKTEHHGHTREVWIGPKAKEIVKPFL